MASPPEYWHKACRILSRRDAIMAKVIRQFPNDYLHGGNDAFETLYRAIVGQQISLKAAASIRSKLEQKIGKITPDNIKSRRRKTLRQCGLSENKTSFLKSTAEFFIAERATKKYWRQHDFDDIHQKLISIKGVGEWSFQMFAIFYLKHPDIYPIGDMGLINALQKNYSPNRILTREKISKLGETWTPWRTVATWYLWRSIDPDPIVY